MASIIEVASLSSQFSELDMIDATKDFTVDLGTKENKIRRKNRSNRPVPVKQTWKSFNGKKDNAQTASQAPSCEAKESDWTSTDSPNTYNPPPNSTSVEVPIMVPHDQMKFVIGSNGKVFKAITARVKGTDYIWYDSSRKIVEVWGSNKGAINRAVRLLNERMLQIQSNNTA
jgi:hypothetical protein